MLHATHCLGNIHRQEALSLQANHWREEQTLDEVTIDEREARKSRLRLQTRQGRDLGIVLPRGTVLTDGDVFAVAEDASKVLIHIALQELMVLTPHAHLTAQERWAWAVRLGHVLGNQHWPVAVVEEQILLPVTVDRAVMETVLRTHHLTDYFTVRYERRAWPEEEHTAWTTHHS